MSVKQTLFSFNVKLDDSLRIRNEVERSQCIDTCGLALFTIELRKLAANGELNR